MVGLHASETIGRAHVVGQRDFEKSLSETQSLTQANSYQLVYEALQSFQGLRLKMYQEIFASCRTFFVFLLSK